MRLRLLSVLTMVLKQGLPHNSYWKYLLLNECVRRPFLDYLVRHFSPLVRWWWPPLDNMPLAEALLPPSAEGKRRDKRKCREQSPSSYFMDVKGPGCCKITTAFGHARAVGLCVGSVSLQEGEQGWQGGLLQKEAALTAPGWRRVGDRPNKHIMD